MISSVFAPHSRTAPGMAETGASVHADTSKMLKKVANA